MKLTVVGCSPAWPTPGGAQSGYLLEGPGCVLLDCGPGVLARLRTNGPNGWPQVDAIVISHFHLDHWGDLVPWVWGSMWGLGREYEKPELWLPPGGREELAAFGTRFGPMGSASRIAIGRSPTRVTPVPASDSRGWPRASTSSSAKRPSSAASSTASLGATSPRRRLSKPSRLQARAGCSSRTDRASSHSTTGFSRSEE